MHFLQFIACTFDVGIECIWYQSATIVVLKKGHILKVDMELFKLNKD